MKLPIPLLTLLLATPLLAEEPVKAAIDATAPGFADLTQDDFVRVNCPEETFTWNDDGVIVCTGKPTGVLRTKKEYTNFELAFEWKHLEPAGNSGLFVWATPESIERLMQLKRPGLPDGIEVQILDNAFTEKMKSHKRATDWFTTHGDVFPVRVKMTPIGKTSPNGSRSFPRQHLSKDHGHWNHYYVRAINGEVRLWVNGQEVSGGTNIEPATGYLCLESEGAPIHFRKLRIRELP